MSKLETVARGWGLLELKDLFRSKPFSERISVREKFAADVTVTYAGRVLSRYEGSLVVDGIGQAVPSSQIADRSKPILEDIFNVKQEMIVRGQGKAERRVGRYTGEGGPRGNGMIIYSHRTINSDHD